MMNKECSFTFYAFSVFHDVGGLIDLMGARKSFAQMFDSMFVVPPIYDDSYYDYQSKYS